MSVFWSGTWSRVSVQKIFLKKMDRTISEQYQKYGPKVRTIELRTKILNDLTIYHRTRFRTGPKFSIGPNFRTEPKFRTGTEGR